MPRPSRTKVASSTAQPRVAKLARPAPTTDTDSGSSQTSRLSRSARSDTANSLGLVSKSRLPPWKLRAENEEDYTMIGGLGEGDAKEAHHRTLPPRRNTRKKMVKKASEDVGKAAAIEALRQRRDAARKGATQTVEIRTTAAPRAATPEAGPLSGEDEVEEASGSPPPAPQAVQQPMRVLDPHLGVPPSSPPRMAIPQSAVKAQGTPAVETSVLALTKFKRRPRQPSILRMIQQTSDLEHSLSDSDDFDPDDESTPLTLSKSRPSIGSAVGSAERSAEIVGTSSSRKRRHSSQDGPEIQVPRSSPPVFEPPVEAQAGRAFDILSDSPSLPDVTISDTQPEPVQPSLQPPVCSPTLASPKSTSPVREVAQEAQLQLPSRKRAKVDHNSDGEGDDRLSGAESSPIQKHRSTRSNKPRREATVFTKDLQALLPRRRRPARNEEQDMFDMPSSDEVEAEMDSDEDELGASTRRKGRAGARRSAASKKTTTTKTTTAAGGKRRGRPAKKPAVVPGPAKAATTAATKGPRISKTYGRRMSSDKENQDENERPESDVDPDLYDVSDQEGNDTHLTSGDAEEGGELSRELRNAVAKFKEVDEWEMEFESVENWSGESAWR